MARSATWAATRALTVIFGALVVAVTMPARASQGEPTKESKPLLFVAKENDPPLNYSENGVPKGRDVDFAYALGKALGRDVRVQLTTWDKARQSIQDGDADG